MDYTDNALCAKLGVVFFKIPKSIIDWIILIMLYLPRRLDPHLDDMMVRLRCDRGTLDWSTDVQVSSPYTGDGSPWIASPLGDDV